MNIQANTVSSGTPTTPEEFLRWNEGREGKREFVRGRVVEMMVGVSEVHWWLVSRLQLIIARQIGLTEFIVGASDYAVRTSDGVRYPDLLVTRPSGERRSLASRAPLLIAEVLSPSSLGRDFVDKLHDYSGTPSLLHYLILSQDEPRIWLWSRPENGSWAGPEEIVGPDATVELAGLACSVSVAELYAGIADPPQS